MNRFKIAKLIDKISDYNKTKQDLDILSLKSKIDKIISDMNEINNGLTTPDLLIIDICGKLQLYFPFIAYE